MNMKTNLSDVLQLLLLWKIEIRSFAEFWQIWPLLHAIVHPKASKARLENGSREHGESQTSISHYPIQLRSAVRYKPETNNDDAYFKMVRQGFSWRFLAQTSSSAVQESKSGGNLASVRMWLKTSLHLHDESVRIMTESKIDRNTCLNRQALNIEWAMSSKHDDWGWYQVASCFQRLMKRGGCFHPKQPDVAKWIWALYKFDSYLFLSIEAI